ncbi:MAG: hypothetical protein ACPL28_05460 [bacterium]
MLSWTRDKIRLLPLIIILSGIVFRLAQYVFNRSLTEGEAPLAMNIVSRTYPDLLKPLDYVQAAPIGFLYLEKLAVDLFGNNEYALRLFPFVTGIAAIFLFYKILKYLGDFNTEIFALVFFVVNDYLIYFSSEVKPYSSDVFFCLLLLLLSVLIIRNNLKTFLLVLWGLVGAICIWFSFPTFFVFSGIGITLLLYVIRNKNNNALIFLFIAGVLWLISMTINYFVCLQHLTQHQGLMSFWQKDFVPLPPKSFKEFYSLIYALLRVFKNPGGFSIYELLFSILSFFVGIIFLWRRKKSYALFLLIPLLITIIGSGLHLYPFEGRVILFIAPILSILVGSGIAFIYDILRRQSQVIAILVVFVLLIQPITIAVYHLIKPRAPEELRPVLEYLRKNIKENELIYVYYGAENAFRYYQEKFPEIRKDYIAGNESRTDWTGYYEEIEKLKGNDRVWFLFSHIATHLGVNEEKLFLTYLDLFGAQIESFQASGASAYLYHFNK